MLLAAVSGAAAFAGAGILTFTTRVACFASAFARTGIFAGAGMRSEVFLVGAMLFGGRGICCRRGRGGRRSRCRCGRCRRSGGRWRRCRRGGHIVGISDAT
jgi:hypothetical protein